MAVLFAMEGADVAIAYLNEHGDAEDTVRIVEEQGRRSVPIACDIRAEEDCRTAVSRAVDGLAGLDVLVNHAGEQHPRSAFEEITAHQLERTFRTNVYSMFFITQAALEHLGEGAALVNTTSVTVYRATPR